MPNTPEGKACGDIDNQGDNKEDEEQDALDPSNYIKSHRYIDSQKPSQLATTKEWVY